ncbi:hypothetical protein PsorP6_014597 [Peronosclerospora sorghi]|uniref:Uncharacterized protein n=1 Tax=Peronosclerospora sorghi TaxID=230839 RepID=A0ACC0VSX9_9STRA|nr:hypothetical protein PsorP6_014597 [Peronosclerospora sorghi]
MSTCPQCFTGTCKRHTYQDNGRLLLKSADAESTLKKMYDTFLTSKLQKLQAQAVHDPSKQHVKAFRKKLDASREKSLRKSHKSRFNVDVTGSGLNPQALAAIYGDDSDVSDDERRKRKKDKRKRRYKHSDAGNKRDRSDSDGPNSSHGSSENDSEQSHGRHKRSSSYKKHRRHSKSHKKQKHKRNSKNVD